VAVLSGFGTDSFNHVSKYGLDYPLIVHFHAVAFVGWLTLFTVQVGLIRTARTDIHRRLGIAGAGLAPIMVVLGPAAALVVDSGRYTATGETPEFLAVQLTDILGSPGARARRLRFGDATQIAPRIYCRCCLDAGASSHGIATARQRNLESLVIAFDWSLGMSGQIAGLQGILLRQPEGSIPLAGLIENLHDFARA
jgi:hypothetical protein